jgi:hypothetical protein
MKLLVFQSFSATIILGLGGFWSDRDVVMPVPTTEFAELAVRNYERVLEVER